MSRKKLAASDLLAQAEANGYKKGKHKEQDKVRDRYKHVDKTKKDHEAALNRYVLWNLGHMERDYVQEGLPPPTKAMARQRFLGKEVEAPDLETVKDFLRFHISTSRGKIVTKPTADSVNAFAEWFFAGFTRVTGTSTDAQDRSEVYHWVRRTLTAEGLVVNKRREKHLFTLRDLTRILLALWTRDDLIFIHERSRIQFTLIFRMYCWTGARLGAFFTGGLCYKDIDLVLQRVDTGGWRLIYQVKQRWVKNNRDPKNIHFGAVGKDHDKLIYNDAAFLLVLAVADDALFGYKSLDDVRRQEIPAGEDQLILSYKEAALDRPILRKCTKAEGVTEDPMPKATFLAIYEKSMKNAGYLCGTSIHAVRRQLGKKVDEKYTSVQRSQHLTQADPRVFGQSYVANCSSVDGQAAFLGEALDHRHVDYFQSLEKFREAGLPCELPAHLEDRLRSDPRLCQMENEFQTLKRQEGSISSLKEAKDRLVSYRKTLKRTTLRQYQQDWTRDRRDWKILTRGKEQADDLCKTNLVQSLCLLIPERGRLALGIASDDPVSPATMWRAMDDLHSLCTRNFTVLYLPGNEPDENACPVKCCRQDMNSLPKTQRNQHIQACVRREMASQLKQLQSNIHYCHQCFQWVVGDGWEKHCQSHLQPITSKICGTVTYIHTLVRPGFCPFCLGNETLPATIRLESWTRDRKMWCHIREHLTGRQWPTRCPHPLCDISLEDEAALTFHFVDEHRITRTHASHPTEMLTKTIREAPGTKRKRRLSQGHEALKWQTPEDFSVSLRSESADYLSPLRSPKRVSSTSPTICPSLISKAEDEVDTHLLQGDVQIVIKSDTNETTDSEETSSHHWISLRAGSELPVEASTSDESSDETLFSQYLRSPSPCLSMKNFDHYIESLTTPTSKTVPDNIQEQLQAAKYKPRIRLRVNPPTPRVVLRLSNPKPARVVKRKRRA